MSHKQMPVFAASSFTLSDMPSFISPSDAATTSSSGLDRYWWFGEREFCDLLVENDTYVYICSASSMDYSPLV